MKRLKIYKTDEGEFCLERINQFNHSSKRLFISEQGLLEALDDYPSLRDYELEVEEQSLWSLVIKRLNE